ncbi:MAG: hypothetical protein WC958_04370 [Dehalococcoidales bacterium]|jgi:hypothetical protein
MQSSLIGKIEKANRYAQEKDRVTFTEFSVDFRGENHTHVTKYGSEGWSCTCDFFSHWGLCCHTMAMGKILEEMLPKEAVSTQVDNPTAMQ